MRCFLIPTFWGSPDELLTLMNAAAVTEIRTAAVSALATRLLAREDACELAIIGASTGPRLVPGSRFDF